MVGLALKYIGGNMLVWLTVSERWGKVEVRDL